MREHTIEWDGPGGSGGVTVLNFLGLSATPGEEQAAIASWLNASMAGLSNQYSATLINEGREFNEQTGATFAFWSAGTNVTFTGAVAQEPVGEASQLLLRWRTEGVVAGRRVQGRTFLPGFNRLSTAGGEVAAQSAAIYTSIAQDFADSGVGFCVWSRPVEGGRAGSAHEVTSGSCWRELAVLRQRRD